jgi:agmatine deiminase
MDKSSYMMPAEWEKHDATLLAWPHHEEDWPGKFEPIPFVYGEIIRYLTQVERVRLLVQHSRAERSARDCLKRVGVDLTKVDFTIIPTDRVWTRDSGPIFVRGGMRQKTMLDWRFNAWAKYDNHKRDDNVPARVGQYVKVKRIQPMYKGKRVVLEGGSIDVNGKGALLTTEECLLSDVQCRNPGFTREDYEKVFSEYLGIKKVIWLGNGITGDDTHGHVDDLARFVNPTTVVTVVEKNKRDKNYAPLQDNLKRLKSARDQNGKKLTVIELPMPKPLIFEGTRLPASYANFYIANKMVLVPTFNDPADRIALSILAKCFPGREIVGIHAVDLVWGFGTLHCLSQQIPA